MDGTRPTVRWVGDSAARSAVVESLAGRELDTSALLESVEASESALYAALKDLSRRQLVVETESGWSVTGRGQLVADLLSQQRAIDGLFDRDDEYWQTHDVSVLPRPFRLRLDALTEYETVRITETDPQRVVREVREVMSDAAWTRILAPIYLDEYAAAMPDNELSRLVLDTKVVTEALNDAVADPDVTRPESTEIRIGEVPIGLTLTPDVVMLSLPKLDGSYDTRSEVRIETEPALQWGQDLFEYCWSRAVAPDSFGEPKN